MEKRNTSQIAPTASPNEPFVRGAISIGVQAVLYHSNIEAVRRAMLSLARSAELGMGEGALTGVTLYLGDSSSTPCLSREKLADLTAEIGDALRIVYDPFRENLGTSKGHNRLAEQNSADFFLIQNPDIVASPRLLQTLASGFRLPGVGMVEAKQLPIEHPKDYDPLTGETSWASGACMLIPASLYRHLRGFDPDSFFLYCDDVDLSWRVRLAGYKVIFQPAAVVFHDKRLSESGKWSPTSAERYYSAEAALFLAHKWSRPDLVQQYLKQFAASQDADLQRASALFSERQQNGSLPEPLDPEHKVGQFVGGEYAKHRFTL